MVFVLRKKLRFYLVKGKGVLWNVEVIFGSMGLIQGAKDGHK